MFDGYIFFLKQTTKKYANENLEKMIQLTWVRQWHYLCGVVRQTKSRDY